MRGGNECDGRCGVVWWMDGWWLVKVEGEGEGEGKGCEKGLVGCEKELDCWGMGRST